MKILEYRKNDRTFPDQPIQSMLWIFRCMTVHRDALCWKAWLLIHQAAQTPSIDKKGLGGVSRLTGFEYSD
jgi:hypothetical protein